MSVAPPRAESVKRRPVSALVVRAAQVLVPWVFAADLAPVDPRSATASLTLPGVAQPTSLSDRRIEAAVTICPLQPSAAARGGDECPAWVADRHGEEPFFSRSAR